MNYIAFCYQDPYSIFDIKCHLEFFCPITNVNKSDWPEKAAICKIEKPSRVVSLVLAPNLTRSLTRRRFPAKQLCCKAVLPSLLYWLTSMFSEWRRRKSSRCNTRFRRTRIFTSSTNNSRNISPWNIGNFHSGFFFVWWFFTIFRFIWN